MNPPPPEGSERVWTDFEIFFEFFELRTFRTSELPSWSSKIDPKIDQNVDVILVSFLAPLGSLLASLLGPLGRPNRPKFGPRGPKIAPRRPKMTPRPAKITIFMPDRDFSKNIEKPMENQCFWLPQPAQDRPKMAPSPVKMAQDRPKSPLEAS